MEPTDEPFSSTRADKHLLTCIFILYGIRIHALGFFFVSQRHRASLRQKDEGAESPPAEDSLRPRTETADCLGEDWLPGDTGVVTNTDPLLPVITPDRPGVQTETLQHTTSTDSESTPQELTGHEPLHAEEGSPADLSAAAPDEAHEEEEEEGGEAPADPGKKNSTRKTKSTSRRRSGRAANRR